MNECKRLWNNYSYKSYKYKDYKLFYCKCFNTKRDNYDDKYYSKLRLDYINKRIYLEIYENDNLIDDQTYWTFDYLKDIVFRKLKYLAIIEITRSYCRDKRLYKFNNIKFYELNSFDNFLKCIEKGYIYIQFRMSGRYENDMLVKMINHGTSFNLDKYRIEELFDIIEV